MKSKTFNPIPNMKNSSTACFLVAGALLLDCALQAADPRTNSWFTSYSGKYARIYTTDVNKTNGVTATTWSNGQQTQSLSLRCPRLLQLLPHRLAQFLGLGA